MSRHYPAIAQLLQTGDMSFLSWHFLPRNPRLVIFTLIDLVEDFFPFYYVQSISQIVCIFLLWSPSCARGLIQLTNSSQGVDPPWRNLWGDVLWTMFLIIWTRLSRYGHLTRPSHNRSVKQKVCCLPRPAKAKGWTYSTQVGPNNSRLQL